MFPSFNRLAKLEIVSFVETPLYQTVGLKGYVFAEILLSLMWSVPSALQSKGAGALSLT